MKLLSFGEIVWDLYPDAKALGGASLNLAAHAALLGADAELWSAVGDDELGREAIEEIKALGVGVGMITTVKDKPTGRCCVTVDGQGIPSYDLLADAAYDYMLSDAPDRDFDVLAYGTLALRGESNKRLIGELLQKKQFPEIYTDLNLRAPFYDRESIELCLSNATTVKISSEELPALMNEIGAGFTSAEDSAVTLSDIYPKIRLILITKGDEGSFCYCTRERSFHHCKARAVTVSSTVGAGDSFGAAFLVGFFEGRGIGGALSLASDISGFVVSRKEAVPLDMREFLNSTLKV